VGLAEEGNVSLIEADLDGPLVVVTGSEADGLSMLTRKHCDQLIRIPLRGATPSLNASVATALLIYEIARRGWMKNISGNAPAPRLVRPQVPTTAAASSSPALDTTQELEAVQSDSESGTTTDASIEPAPETTSQDPEATTPIEPTPEADTAFETTPEADVSFHPAPEASSVGEIQDVIEEGIEEGIDDVIDQEIQADTEEVIQEMIQDESPQVAPEDPAPELDLRVSLPEAIELGFTPATGSPFQGDIRL
jgi:23S rRNA (guanosine2251-2'-O)-methyltransferase